MPWKYQNRPINPDNLIITQDTRYKVCRPIPCNVSEPPDTRCLDCKVPEIAQTLQVIQEFIDCGLYAHEEWRGLSMHGDYECKPDCQVCTLQRELTKDFPELRQWIKKGARGD